MRMIRNFLVFVCFSMLILALFRTWWLGGFTTKAQEHMYFQPPPISGPVMEFQEVKPYTFAELPHGRIYKTVHEGCELYVVENDFYTYGARDQHQYAITSGRGCK
jgi:hypothetical protein